MLTADDPLPSRPRRVVVAGVSGSGKTRLAGRIGAALDLPHTEIDALFHGPNWTPRESFVEDVTAMIATGAWVIEWQYTPARPLLARSADLMVWLDLPYLQTFTRVVRRTVRRRLRHEELWNGNFEGPLHEFFTDRDHVIRWSISTRDMYAALVPAALVANPHLACVRLRNQSEVDRWVTRLNA